MTYTADSILVHLERKVSPETVPEELVGTWSLTTAVKRHVTYFLRAMHMEKIQEGSVFFFGSSSSTQSIIRLPITDGRSPLIEQYLNKMARMQHANLF